MKGLVVVVVFACLMVCGRADIYMHNLPGSNNRNCENNGGNTENAQRLFDSQNNNNGNYNCRRAWPFPCHLYRSDADPTKFDECNQLTSEIDTSVGGNGRLTHPEAVNTPSMYFYSGSILALEWTVQHGLGPNDELHSNVVIQYACSDTLTDNCGAEIQAPANQCKSPFYPDPAIAARCGPRDGIPTRNTGSTLERQSTDKIPETVEDQSDYRYGRHETLQYYQQCRQRKRNGGLWIADQNVGSSAGHTRQNPGGTRYGFECAEEKAYYPYWHHSPWKDVAVLVEDEERCEFYRSESQNVKRKGRCDCGGECTNQASQPNNRGECEVKGYTWCEDPSHNLAPPECIVAEFNRQNHLGNTGREGTSANAYNWTIPEVSSPQFCVLRIRYNITTKDGNDIPNTGNARYNGASSPVKDNDNNEEATYMQIAGLGRQASFGFAVNTDQYGRTFEDRSYLFEIRPAPTDGECEGRTIHNLNIRGKRGNIVQSYPAVEYDFVPNHLVVTDRECVHVQWAGSDYNADRDGNDAEGGPYDPVSARNPNNNQRATRADRHNLVQMSNAGHNFPITDISQMSLFDIDESQYKKLMFLGQKIDDPEVCWSIERLKQEFPENREEREADHHNCGKLSGELTPYFDLGPVRPKERGEFVYMSTRDNNFSNRGMKGRMTVIRGGLSVGGIIGITIASLLAVAGGYKFYKYKKAQNDGANYSATAAIKDSSLPVYNNSSGSSSGGGISGKIAAFTASIAALAKGSSSASGAGAGDPDVFVAKFDHQAQESNELSFKKGDRIKITERDSSGWWEGELLATGETGVLPSNYLRR